jgi:dihydrofolate synthase/folylpolyglutamate synthase
MIYEETIEYLYRSAPLFQERGSAAYKEGMENTFLIDRRLGHPHTAYPAIHVAGTNGKGSVCHLLASVLQEAGYKTGLYTSPHLLDFRERIKINGRLIDRDFIVDFIDRNRNFFETIRPSFFELTTGMAFAFFEREKIDVAVVETGLGGRLDCTNVLTPALSIITNISLDHTNLLGNTPAAIAREKAGILKPGVPALVGEAEGEVKEVFRETAAKLPGVTLTFAEEKKPVLSSRLLPSGYWELETKLYPGLIDELGGLAQEKNAATVLSAIDLLKPAFTLPPKAVYGGFRRVVENTGLYGRWQILRQNPKIVLDTGHNAAGIAFVARQLQIEKYARLHILFGMVNDKDIDPVLRLLPPQARYYFTRARIPRALDAGRLAEQAAKYGLKGETFPSVSEAFSAALKNAAENDFIFIGGSTFVVAEALEQWQTIHNS